MPVVSAASSRSDGLRLMVYDRTCRGKILRPGLSHSWWCGAYLYRALSRLDAWQGVDSWSQAFAWLAGFHQPIAEIQYWGHGHWGNAWVGKERWDQRDLLPESPHYATLQQIRHRLVESTGLFWLRTCESFGARAGHEFAAALADFWGCRVAGHTYVIGPWQSGLHSLAAGMQPDWPAEEGLSRGTAAAPEQAHNSSPWAPNTIHCLQGSIPRGY